MRCNFHHCRWIFAPFHVPEEEARSLADLLRDVSHQGWQVDPKTQVSANISQVLSIAAKVGLWMEAPLHKARQPLRGVAGHLTVIGRGDHHFPGWVNHSNPSRRPQRMQDYLAVRQELSVGGPSRKLVGVHRDTEVEARITPQQPQVLQRRGPQSGRQDGPARILSWCFETGSSGSVLAVACWHTLLRAPSGFKGQGDRVRRCLRQQRSPGCCPGATTSFSH
mmetsp:Transcript_60577/g.131298  ORF Transcript_60577/g.131298 Transcript_60577/m.131298 type:complete len:222 (-) Transcript_60577:29-694(-)